MGRKESKSAKNNGTSEGEVRIYTGVFMEEGDDMVQQHGRVTVV
jgi:hypothetical protein